MRLRNRIYPYSDVTETLPWWKCVPRLSERQMIDAHETEVCVRQIFKDIIKINISNIIVETLN